MFSFFSLPYYCEPWIKSYTISLFLFTPKNAPENNTRIGSQRADLVVQSHIAEKKEKKIQQKLVQEMAINANNKRTEPKNNVVESNAICRNNAC